ncbi:hypothetical protein B0H13DRAFT_1871285 [Mycena leptocephala]|nr:hypothetical protein B0H13DRAFT_1871285 [Mycena leptocephala]
MCLQAHRGDVLFQWKRGSAVIICPFTCRRSLFRIVATATPQFLTFTLPFIGRLKNQAFRNYVIHNVFQVANDTKQGAQPKARIVQQNNGGDISMILFLASSILIPGEAPIVGGRNTYRIQANQSLRRIALAKKLWLSLVDDLGFRGVLDLPLSEVLEGSSTAELVNYVKRGVVGPASWLPGSPSPMLRHQSTFNADGAEDLIDMHLLPGGRVWSCAAEYRSTCWSTDLLPGGTTLRVLLLPLHSSGHPHKNICVQEGNLVSGRSNKIFSLNLATEWQQWMSRILGDFFVFALQPSNAVQIIFLLVNWRAKKCVLNYAGRPHLTTRVVLIPDHIVVTYAHSAEPYQQLLAITSFSSLDPHWKSFRTSKISLRHQLDSPDIPFVKHEWLKYERRPLCNATGYLTLAAFPSILHRDSYTIVLYACGNIHRESNQSLAGRVRDLVRRGETEPCTVLFSYRISPASPSRLWNGLLTSAINATPALRARRLSYAGYCVNAGERVEIDSSAGTAVVDARPGRAGRVELHARTVLSHGSGWECMRLSSSWAVMVLKGSSIVVSYYA